MSLIIYSIVINGLFRAFIRSTSYVFPPFPIKQKCTTPHAPHSLTTSSRIRLINRTLDAIESLGILFFYIFVFGI